MAKESYIERLQREREELVSYVKKVEAWKDALEHLKNTGRKGSAMQEVVRKEREMDDAVKSIRQYLN